MYSVTAYKRQVKYVIGSSGVRCWWANASSSARVQSAHLSQANQLSPSGVHPPQVGSVEQDCLASRPVHLVPVRGVHGQQALQTETQRRHGGHVATKHLRWAARQAESVCAYLQEHPELLRALPPVQLGLVTNVRPLAQGLQQVGQTHEQLAHSQQQLNRCQRKNTGDR